MLPSSSEIGPNVVGLLDSNVNEVPKLNGFCAAANIRIPISPVRKGPNQEGSLFAHTDDSLLADLEGSQFYERTQQDHILPIGKCAYMPIMKGL